MNITVFFVLRTHRRSTRTGHCTLRSGRMTELLLLMLRMLQMLRMLWMLRMLLMMLLELLLELLLKIAEVEL